MKKIYIDQEIIKENERRGEVIVGPIMVKENGNTKDYVAVEIKGPCRILYAAKGEHPRVWIETESPVSTF